MNRRVIWLWLAVGLVIALAVGGYLAYQRTIYGRVGSHFVTKSQVAKVVSASPIFKTQEVGDAYMDMYLYQELAKDYKVSVSQSEIDTEMTNRTGLKDPYNKDFLTVAITRDLLQQKIQEKVAGYYKGKFVLANFDRYIPYGDNAGPDNPVAGRTQRIAADRAYAQAFSGYIYDQLVANKLTFDQAVEQEHNDSRLGHIALPTSLHSGDFNTADSTLPSTSLLSSTEVMSVLKSTKVGSFSLPVIAKIDSSAVENAPRVDGKFIILLVQDASTKSDKSFDEVVSAKKKQVGYKKY